jgi:hypothetical protein
MTTSKFQTMTPGGLYGSVYEAEDADAAVLLAEAAGDKVLDITEHGGETILVVSDR